MNRFYLENFTLEKDFSLKNNAIIKQISKILRLKIKDKIILFNGKENKDFVFSIKNIGKRDITLSYLDIIEKPIPKKINLNLYNSLPNKLSKIEYIVQKGVEIGFDSFTFFKSTRSKNIIFTPNKIKRLEKIIIESVEQSGRNTIPKIIVQNKKLDTNFTNKKIMNLFFHTSIYDSNDLKNILTGSSLKTKKDINLFVGPEGGWDEREVKNFKEIGFTQIFLGNNILRTETVSLVVGFFIHQYF